MESLSASFRTLGDPTRLRILRLLASASLNVSELVSLVGVAQPSVSHHLGRLKQTGLIREERQAGFSYYALSAAEDDPCWPLIRLAKEAEDHDGDLSRLDDLLRGRADREALNEKLLEPGQSWFLWAGALASLLPPLKVADFGCGSGVLSLSIARWAKEVVAIDQRKVALDQARAAASRQKVKNVVYLQEDLHALSLESRSIDLVVISQSLHHVEEPRAVLREAYRILKRDGKLAVLELMPHREDWVRGRLGHRHLGFEPDQLSKMLEEVGFQGLLLEPHARTAASPFRVFLLTGVKR